MKNRRPQKSLKQIQRFVYTFSFYSLYSERDLQHFQLGSIFAGLTLNLKSQRYKGFDAKSF